jgi:hypothetical protein
MAFARQGQRAPAIPEGWCQHALRGKAKHRHRPVSAPSPFACDPKHAPDDLSNTASGHQVEFRILAFGYAANDRSKQILPVLKKAELNHSFA